jgi:LysM domain
MTCFACEREPTQQCSRCGRPYCDEHGEELCDSCMEPSSGVPSVSLYRGSMLALLIGTAIAIYLLVKPGGGESASAVRPILLTPTVQSSGRSITIPPAGSTAVPGAQTTPAAGTPRATGTVPAGSTPGAAATAPAGAGEYTVASGDTLGSICEKVKPATMTVPDCVERVVALNNLRSPNDISIGDRLRVPR